MPDVFVSHASGDAEFALKLCALIERRGLRCWIAPRDVPPGSHYGGAIVEAIEHCAALVLVLSEEANRSVHVGNEVERAVSKGKSVFTVRIRNVSPSKALELFISSSQWTEAWVPPIEQKVDRLCQAIRALLPREEYSALEVKTGRARPSHQPRTARAWVALAVVILVGAVLLWVLQTPAPVPQRAETTSTPAAPVASAPATPRGPASLQTSFDGPGRVIDAAFSTDGTRVLAGFSGVAGRPPTGRPPVILMWDLESGRQVAEVQISRTLCLAFSHDRRQALAGDPWGLDLIDLATKQPPRHFDAGFVNVVRFLPDGARALSGGSDLQLWDLNAATVIRRFEGHSDRVLSLAVSSDGQRAISGGADAIRAWDVETGRELWRAEGSEARFQSLVLSPDGRRVLAGDDGVIRVLDAATGRDVGRWSGFKGYTLSLAFSQDGRRALSGGTDNVVRLWDTATGVVVERHPVSDEWTGAVGFSSDGRMLLAGTIDGKGLQVWPLSQ